MGRENILISPCQAPCVRAWTARAIRKELDLFKGLREDFRNHCCQLASSHASCFHTATKQHAHLPGTIDGRARSTLLGAEGICTLAEVTLHFPPALTEPGKSFLQTALPESMFCRISEALVPESFDASDLFSVMPSVRFLSLFLFAQGSGFVFLLRLLDWSSTHNPVYFYRVKTSNCLVRTCLLQGNASLSGCFILKPCSHEICWESTNSCDYLTALGNSTETRSVSEIKVLITDGGCKQVLETSQ